MVPHKSVSLAETGGRRTDGRSGVKELASQPPPNPDRYPAQQEANNVETVVSRRANSYSACARGGDGRNGGRLVVDIDLLVKWPRTVTTGNQRVTPTQ